jgi:hypothetical protein
MSRKKWNFHPVFFHPKPKYLAVGIVIFDDTY